MDVNDEANHYRLIYTFLYFEKNKGHNNFIKKTFRCPIPPQIPGVEWVT